MGHLRGCKTGRITGSGLLLDDAGVINSGLERRIIL